MCKVVGPEYAAASLLAQEHLPTLAFASVNSDKESELAESLGVTTFPRFFLYKGGDSEPFPLLPTGEAIVAGAARLLGVEGAESLSPAKEFSEGGGVVEKFVKWLFWRGKEGGKLDTTLVLFSPPAQASCSVGGGSGEGQCSQEGAAAGAAAADSLALEAAFDAAAGELLKDPTIRFARVRAASVVEDLELPLDRPTLVLYKEHDEGRAVYGGVAEGGAIVTWAKVQNVPLVTHVTHKNLQRVRKDAPLLAILFLEESQTEHLPTLTRVMEALKGVVYELEAEGVVTRGGFTLGVSNGKKYSSWVSNYGLPSGTLPALGGEEVLAERVHHMSDPLGMWAKEGLCAGGAVGQVGVHGKWRVILSHLCEGGARVAAVEKVKGEMVEAGGEPEEVALMGIDAIEPGKRQFPLALVVAALDLDMAPVKQWIKGFVLAAKGAQ